MKSNHSRNERRWFAAGFLLLLFSPLILAQSSPGDNESTPDPPSVVLDLRINDIGPADVYVDYDTVLENKYDFPQMAAHALGCPLENLKLSRDDVDQSTSLAALCQLPLRRSFFTKAGAVDLRDFRAMHDADSAIMLELSVLSPHNQTAACDPVADQAPLTPPAIICVYKWDNSSQAPPAVRFNISYGRALIFRALAVLGFLLLIPLVLTFWFRRRALDVPDQAKPALVFAYRRFLTWTALFGSLIWWAAADLLQADQVVAFFLRVPRGINPAVADSLPVLFLILLPATVYFLCLCLSSPMQALRGTVLTRPQLVNRSFLAVGRFVIPIPMLWIGFAEFDSSLRLGVTLVIAAFVLFRFLSVRFMRAYGMDLHSLTAGELRDRAFALAAKANTKLNQLYVLPMSSLRIANAFAHSAQNIFLSDYLVESMSKREVDAVVAHEITHLQKKHSHKRMALVFVFIFAVAFGTIYLQDRVPSTFPTGPILYALLLLSLFFVSRRDEFTADAGAATITGDPEAMMTALARLTRLNTMPLQWSKLDEKVLSHPSTLRRIQRLARDANISEARTEEILAQAFAPPLEKYAIPATALPAGKIFSTRYKSSTSRRLALAVMLVSPVIPASVALAVQSRGIDGGLRWLVYLVGIVLTLTVDLVLLNRGAMLGSASLEHRLREKRKEQQPSIDPASGIFVSLAPDSTPRLYEGNWAWDIGFVSLISNRLVYWGEEAAFSLDRNQITSIARRPGPSSWFGTDSLYISWTSSTGQSGTFNIRAIRGKSLRETCKRTMALFHDLENWRIAGVATDSPVYTEAANNISNSGAPAFREVTSASPATISTRLFLRDLLLNWFLALAVIVIFGLMQADGPSDLNALLPGLYVLLVVWLSRVLVYAPFWLARRKHQPAEAPVVAVTGK